VRVRACACACVPAANLWSFSSVRSSFDLERYTTGWRKKADLVRVRACACACVCRAYWGLLARNDVARDD
jgi:hypothetical protein